MDKGVRKQEKQPPADPYLELEYKECVESGRFIGGVRFSFFGAFLTFFVVLIGGYTFVWTSEKTVFGALKPVLLVLISLFGLLIAFAGRLIETRNTRLNETHVNRAIALERQMTEDAIRRGYTPREKERIRIYELMDQPSVKTPVYGVKATHGVAIALTYRAIEVIWFLMFWFSIYLLFKR